VNHIELSWTNFNGVQGLLHRMADLLEELLLDIGLTIGTRQLEFGKTCDQVPEGLLK